MRGAAAALHASGPLPAIRVGPQPYGVLPVASRRLSPHLDSAVDLNLHRYSGMLRSMWDEQVHRVPRLGAPARRAVDDVMLELLQRTPVPWELRWREIVPPPQWTATEWLATSRARQVSWLYDVTDRLDIPPDRPARFQYLTATVDSHPLGVPLVAKGDAGTYVAEIAALARQGDEGRRAQPAPELIALLEALLAFAAVQELDKAASAELGRASPWRIGRRPASPQGRAHPRSRAGGGARPAAAPMQFAPARTLAAQIAPGSPVAVHDQVATRLGSAELSEHIGQPASPVNGLARFLAALDVLRRHRPPSWSGRSGACSTCSAAHRRLVHVLRHRPPRRAARGAAAGRPRRMLRLVEDLHRQRSGRRQPGLHPLPSLAHAVTAALLRSGRQSHLADGAFDLDMSSARGARKR